MNRSEINKERSNITFGRVKIGNKWHQTHGGQHEKTIKFT